MTDFTNCSIISIFDFEQANVVWVHFHVLCNAIYSGQA